MISFTILGQCWSLKNGRIPIMHRGRVIFIPNEKVKAFDKQFGNQIPKACRQKITTPIHVEIEIFYPSNQQDLDEALVCDLLQKYDVIANDRQIVSKFVTKRIDPKCPRVTVKIEPITWERTGKQRSLLDEENSRETVRPVR